MANPSFFWHDYETTGIDPWRDRATQFAGIRTNLDLQPIDEPVSLFCQPAPDSLPHPRAVLLTGITPQKAQHDGVTEAEFAAAVHEQLAEPGICGVGFNSLRFDDVFTRNLLYRNFHDPYAREWRNDNSRWDIIDLARMCYALRPHGIEWPQRDDGTPSFKLEHLATANKLEQRRAHDAVSDVEATIALARLLRTRQPKLWDWFFKLRNKRSAAAAFDVVGMTPLLHVSSRYPASRGCLSIIVPLAQHPTRSNEMIVYDLACEPTQLLALDADAIADRVFTARADLPKDVERIALRTVHVNQSPALAPLSVLKGVDMARINLDIDQCLARSRRLRGAAGLAEKARHVFAAAASSPPADDPELALYGGFLPDADKPLLAKVRATPPDQLNPQTFPFCDPRYPELLFRYRARNWPHTLSGDERRQWQQFRQRRLTRNTSLTTLTLEDYFAEIDALRADSSISHEQRALLDPLQQWGRDLADDVGVACSTV